MGDRLQLRRDTAANWSSNNPILRNGEPGVETDADPIRVKIGDGSTHWNDLDYSFGNVNETTNNNYSATISGGNLASAAALGGYPAAVSAIGATPTTLLIDTDLPITANPQTVPTNIDHFPVSGAKWTKSGSGKMTFTHPGIIGDPQHQIFSGFAVGDVKWTGPYPQWFRPEWWGAVGDNVTDDLPAFNAMLTAFQQVNALQGTFYSGARVLLTPGKKYFLNGTLAIHRPVTMSTMLGADYVHYTTALRFPANTPGIIIHGNSTVDGIEQLLLTAMGTRLEGFSVVGTASANNTVVSTSGLTVTLTGGSITSVSRRGNNAGTVTCVSPGTTVTISDYEYVVGDSLSATATSSVPIEAPRVLLFLASPGSVLSMGDYTFLPSNNDWAGSTISIGGTSYPVVSNTTTSITVTGTVPAGLYTATVTGGIKSQTGLNARLNIYHGIDVRIRCQLHNIRVNSFSGNGLDMNSERFPSAYIGTEPNANNSHFFDVNCDDNLGSGFAFYGINSNNFETHLLNTERNHGYGIYEKGTLGANHYSFHNAYNWKGAYSFLGAVAANNIQNCYSEGGQPTGLIGPYTQVIGGDHAADFDFEYGYATHLTTDIGRFITQGAIAVKKYAKKYLSILVPKAVMIALGSKNEPSTIMSFGAGEDAANTGGGNAASDPVLPCYFLSYNQVHTGWFSLGYGTNYAGVNAMAAMSGSQAAVGPGHLAFPAGIRLRVTDTEVKGIRHGTAVLVAGTVTVSDTTITANTRVFVQRQTDGGTVAASYSITRTPTTSFTITAKDGAGAAQTADTSTVAYWLVEP
jgi:hypothetical protein